MVHLHRLYSLFRGQEPEGGVVPAVREAVHGVPPAVPHDGLGLRLRPERGRAPDNTRSVYYVVTEFAVISVCIRPLILC